MKETQIMNRREFWRRLARGSLLTLLVGGGGWMAGRSGRCDRHALCRGCPGIGDCSLPQAQLFRQKGRS
ncbi:MAG: hypothetical protein PHV34_01185 [Verrucomicrobiae bacterium]|nr:hypothetical protein [Verrucomicrobiae bacterium]